MPTDSQNSSQIQPQPMSPWMYSAPAYGEEEINLLDYWRILMRRKWQIILLTILVSVLVFFYSLNLPKQYTSEVLLMPVSGGSSGGLGALASQLGSIPLIGSQLGGLTGGLGDDKGKELVNILESRTLTEKIIQRFSLMQVIFFSRWDPESKSFYPDIFGAVPVLEDAINTYHKKIVSAETNKKTGLVKIEVTMKDPELAAKIANGMVVELQDFINRNSLTMAKRNRIFIEEQMVRNRAKLLEAGKELNQFYADNRISSVVPQLDVNVGSYQTSPKSFKEFREELDALNEDQLKIKGRQKTEFVKAVPGQVYLEYLALNKELLGKAHALLTQQYELSKIEESKEDLAFQVIDKARVMVRPSSPKVLLNTAVAFVGGFFLSVFIAFFREFLQKAKADG